MRVSTRHLRSKGNIQQSNRHHATKCAEVEVEEGRGNILSVLAGRLHCTASVPSLGRIMFVRRTRIMCYASVQNNISR